MNRTRLVFVVVAVLACCSLMFGQGAGSFSYGTGNSITGTTACMMNKSGVITGGQECRRSSLGLTEFSPLTACPVLPATCATATGNPAAVCDPNTAACGVGIGCCAIPLVLSCTETSQCLDFYGSNSGATCVDIDPPLAPIPCPVGGLDCTCTLPANSGTCIGSAKAGIKTNSGSGNVFDIRTAALVGLLTDVTLSEKQTLTSSGSTSSSALAGVQFRVTVDPESGQPKPSLTPTGYITFDARYVQITTNLFQAIAGGCPASIGGCFLTFAESTVSAHSYDWIAGSTFADGTPLSSGEYDVTVDWMPSAGFGVTGIGEALICVSSVNLIIQQDKIYHFNEVNDVTP